MERGDAAWPEPKAGGPESRGLPLPAAADAAERADGVRPEQAKPLPARKEPKAKGMEHSGPAWPAGDLKFRDPDG